MRKRRLLSSLMTSTLVVLSNIPLHEAFSPSSTAATPLRHSPSRTHGSSSQVLFYASEASETSSARPYANSISPPEQQQRNRPSWKNPRHAWLQQATQTLLDSEPGSLDKGRWHQIVSMMSAWSKLVKDDPAAPLILERLLKRVIDEKHAGNTEAATTTKLYRLVLDAWTSSVATHGKAASRRARDILFVLQQTFEVEGDTELMPDAHCFGAVLQAVGKGEDAMKAREMIMWMEELYQSGRNPNARPSLGSYVIVLDAFAESKREDSGVLAESFLRHMNETGIVFPDTLCWNVVIKAYVKSKQGRSSAEHAERILEEMETEPDVVTWGSVVNAWASSGMKEHAAERAEEILRQVEESDSVRPSTFLYNSCLNAWCKSNSPLAVNRSEALLQRMEASDYVSPDIITYNTFLHALAMNGKVPGMAQRADDLMCEWERRFDEGQVDFGPNTFSYNLVIEGYARCRNNRGATRACDILRKLVQRDGVEPDIISFNQVISALSRSSLPGAAQRAEGLLEYMDRNYESGVSNVKPDVISYSSTITAWARSGEPKSAERAERLLNEMEHRYASGDFNMKPNIVPYNAVIDAWARSGEGTLGARRAEAVLSRMQARVEAGNKAVAPNIVTYNSLLHAWARSGTRCCAYKAETYLEKMWQLYEGGNLRVKPDDKSYNTVINAVSKSRNEGKAQKALRILRRMDKLYQAGNARVRPNELTYTAVLNSCAFPAAFDPKSRRKAMDTAIFTLEELQESQYGKPNHITYATFLKACANLMPMDDELRRMIVKRVFEKACQDGQVGKMVLAHLRDAAPRDLYEQLLDGVKPQAGSRIALADLPEEWRRNVQERKRWRGRRMPIRTKGKHRQRRTSRRLERL